MELAREMSGISLRKFCQLPPSLRVERIKGMAATVLSAHDDTKFFEQALQEYREAVGDYSTFLDLPRETQRQVLDRAQQLKDDAFRRLG